MPTSTLPTTSQRAATGSTMLDLLLGAINRDASDLHLVAGQPPAYRVHGALSSLDAPALEPAPLTEMIRTICPPEVASRLDTAQNVDFSYQREIEGATRRFRVNVFSARRSLGCSIRVILDQIPSLTWAGFPPGVAERITTFRNGLVLFTGITGSGKSTTMAMLIEVINQRGGSRIITIEEPIEYVLTPQPNTVISQREVGADLSGFHDGLKYGLRQDPDVILVGEVRDRETAQLAISAAETGHLVLTTMHTRDAKGAITRLADMFPQDAQGEIRSQLAMSLRGVVSQHLLPPATPGDRRVLGVEVLFNNLPISSAIRAGKIETISDSLLAGRVDGMIPLDECLKQLVQANRITPDVAREYANDPRRIR